MNKSPLALRAFYILGTAVAIATAMLVAVVINIMTGNMYPEVNRSRTYYVTSVFKTADDDAAWLTHFSRRAISEVFSQLKCAEAASLLASNMPMQASVGYDTERVAVTAKFTDPAFFRLYQFRFVDGGPYSKRQFDAADECAVISNHMARRLFDGETRVAGSTVLIDGKPIRICGVVEAATNMMSTSAADIYMPYTCATIQPMISEDSSNPYRGNIEVRLMLNEGCTRQMLHDELDEYFTRYISAQTAATGQQWQYAMMVRSHFFRTLNIFSAPDERTIDYVRQLMPFGVMMLIFLLLPAINMSSIVSVMMEGRMAEMGIRKAFGARRRRLLREVLTDNLWFTCIGGVVGYVLCYAVCNIVGQSTLWMRLFGNTHIIGGNAVQVDMLVNLPMFVTAFACCALLNIMAAFIPAWHTLRQPIVESLNQKQ